MREQAGRLPGPDLVHAEKTALDEQFPAAQANATQENLEPNSVPTAHLHGSAALAIPHERLLKLILLLVCGRPKLLQLLPPLLLATAALLWLRTQAAQLSQRARQQWLALPLKVLQLPCMRRDRSRCLGKGSCQVLPHCTSGCQEFCAG